jgi:hypothetical protein
MNTVSFSKPVDIKPVVTALRASPFERDLRDGDWKTILQVIARMPEPPRLLFSSRLADPTLLDETHALGAYSLLASPLESREIPEIGVTVAKISGLPGPTGKGREQLNFDLQNYGRPQRGNHRTSTRTDCRNLTSCGAGSRESV